MSSGSGRTEPHQNVASTESWILNLHYYFMLGIADALSKHNADYVIFI